MNIQPVDFRGEVVEAVQRGFTRPPVVLGGPVVSQVAGVLQRDALAPVTDTLRLGPTGARQARSQIIENVVGNGDTKRLHGLHTAAASEAGDAHPYQSSAGFSPACSRSLTRRSASAISFRTSLISSRISARSASTAAYKSAFVAGCWSEDRAGPTGGEVRPDACGALWNPDALSTLLTLPQQVITDNGLGNEPSTDGRFGPDRWRTGSQRCPRADHLCRMFRRIHRDV